MMQVNKKIIAIFSVLMVAMLLAPSLQARPIGISNVETGCTCHSGSPSSDVSPFMTLANGSALPDIYNAAQTYSFLVGFTGGPGDVATETQENMGGFNLVASKGTLASTDNSTQIMAGQLTHTDYGNDQTSWTVEWTSPASGTPSFTLTVNSVNGDNQASDADHWAQSTFTMSSMGGGAEPLEEANGLTVLFSAIILVMLLLFVAIIYVFYRTNPEGFSWSAFAPWLADWLTSTDHKKIGTLYFVAGLFYFVVGGVLALLMRTQLAVPGNDFLTKDEYNQFFTLHGTIMIFLAAMPMINGFANWIVPLQIGAKDLAFPRINAMAFWLNPVASVLIMSGIFSSNAADVGWT